MVCHMILLPVWSEEDAARSCSPTMCFTDSALSAPKQRGLTPRPACFIRSAARCITVLLFRSFATYFRNNSFVSGCFESAFWRSFRSENRSWLTGPSEFGRWKRPSSQSARVGLRTSLRLLAASAIPPRLGSELTIRTFTSGCKQI